MTRYTPRSGFLGVSWDKATRTWRATLNLGVYGYYDLGLYDTRYQANDAVIAAERALFGAPEHGDRWQVTQAWYSRQRSNPEPLPELLLSTHRHHRSLR